MATRTLPASHILDDEDAPAAVFAPSRKPSPLRRLYDAIIESQMQRARREIARVLEPNKLEQIFRAALPPER